MSISFLKEWNKNKIEKAIKEAKELDNACKPTPPEEEWVWVEGYKGTDRNMCCRDFQYEMNKQFDMSEDTEIKECENGFHLCLTLNDTFKYYSVTNGHRFFKVKALVRKVDEEKYGTAICSYFLGEKMRIGTYDKLAAKSIIFLSELTIDEIIDAIGGVDLPEQYKPLVIEGGTKYAYDNYNIDTLVEDGYSKPFATHIVKTNKFDIAHTIGSQKDLSMDMKVLYILNN